jgi:hypothetical protein
VHRRRTPNAACRDKYVLVVYSLEGPGSCDPSVRQLIHSAQHEWQHLPEVADDDFQFRKSVENASSDKTQNVRAAVRMPTPSTSRDTATCPGRQAFIM